MIKKQTLQSGSTALIIIIAITAVVIGGLGYAWWRNTNKHSAQANTQATNIQNSTEADGDMAKEVPRSNEYLVIEEWGVKLKTSLTDHLTYQPKHIDNTGLPTPYDELGLRIKSTSVSDQDCTTFGIDLYRQLTPSDRFESKKIGDYYYHVTGAPGVCSEEPSDMQLQQTALTELTLSNLEKI